MSGATRLAAWGMLLSLAAGHAGAQTTVILEPVKDNSIFQENANASNGADESVFAGTELNGSQRRALLAFDVSMIPATATITEAEMRLFMTRTRASSVLVSAHALTSDWGEGNADGAMGGGAGANAGIGDATWSHHTFDSGEWSMPGGDFDALPVTSASVNTPGSYLFAQTPDFLELVQGWVDGSRANFGLVLMADDGASDPSAKRFASREAGNADNRPKLIVTFEDEGMSNELVDGSQVMIDLPAVGAGQAMAVSEMFIDVPADATRLRTDLVDPTDRDVDLLLARTPFPTDLNNVNAFFDHAEYQSAGVSGNEFVTIGDSVDPAVHGERWYIAVLAFPGGTGQATLTTDIDFGAPEAAQFVVDFDNGDNTGDCDIAPWNDATPFTPQGGNSATTLGEARRNGMLEAARLLSEQLFSPVPILVRACWTALGGDNTGATLASARSNFLLPNGPGQALQDTFYVQAVAARLAGTAYCNLDAGTPCTEEEVFIRFNTDVDGDVALGTRHWYYGFTGPSGTDVDFVSTAIHEITHGLGFSSLYSQGGAPLAAGITDAYSVNMIDNSGATPVALSDPATTNSQRASAFTSVDGLQWTGPESSVGADNPLANLNDGYVRLYAPDPFEPGSSVSHLDASYCALMRFATSGCNAQEFRGLGVERAMLHEVGWSPARNTPPALGLYFDRAHDSHGFDFQLGGVDPVLGPIYVMTFYSYENLAFPEWFQAVGPIQNGTFYGLRSDATGGFGLPTVTFDAARNPPQQADPGRYGQVAFTFNDPAGRAECNDGVTRGDLAPSVFQWAVDNQRGNWCMELVPGTDLRPDPDFGGLWFAGGDDQGWGFSLENVLRDDGTIGYFVLIYVYAADGTPVWFLGAGESTSPVGPVEIELLQRRGYGRSQNPTVPTDTVAGSFTINFEGSPTSPLDGSNRISIDVTYQGAEGGDWIRDDVAVVRLSQPRD